MAKPKQTVEPHGSGTDGGQGGSVRSVDKAVQFVGETYREMKRIRWPKRQEVVNYTTASLVTCLVMGLLVWVFDLGVSKLMSLMGLV